MVRGSYHEDEAAVKRGVRLTRTLVEVADNEQLEIDRDCCGDILGHADDSRAPDIGTEYSSIFPNFEHVSRVIEYSSIISAKCGA